MLIFFRNVDARSRPDLINSSGLDERHGRGEIVALCERQ